MESSDSTVKYNANATVNVGSLEDIDSVLMPPPPPKKTKIDHDHEQLFHHCTDEPKLISIPEPQSAESYEMSVNEFYLSDDCCNENQNADDNSIQFYNSPDPESKSQIDDGDSPMKINNGLESNDKAKDVQTHSQQKNSRRNTFDEPPIKTRFTDIIGHGSAKLRLDEMLLPLALPSSLANSVLKGKLSFEFTNSILKNIQC